MHVNLRIQGVTKYVKGGEKGLMEALLTKGPMTGSTSMPASLQCQRCTSAGGDVARPTAAGMRKVK
jgi:hypothetical protein